MRHLAILKIAPFALLITITGSGCAVHHCDFQGDPPSQCCFTSLAPNELGVPYQIFTTKTGTQPVLLMHELNGLSPGTLSLALDLEKRGYRVYMPVFFGSFGQNNIFAGYPQVICSSRWHSFDKHDAGPVRQDVMMMAGAIIRKHPGKELLVIGNCLSGSLALEPLIDLPQVRTAICCQPALPNRVFGDGDDYLGLPECTLKKVADTLHRHPEKHLISFTYYDDIIAPYEKTRHLAMVLRGDGVSPRQHTVVVLVNPCTDAKAASEARAYGWKVVETRYSAGHSTITGALRPDVCALRNVLWEELDAIKRGH